MDEEDLLAADFRCGETLVEEGSRSQERPAEVSQQCKSPFDQEGLLCTRSEEQAPGPGSEPGFYSNAVVTVFSPLIRVLPHSL